MTKHSDTINLRVIMFKDETQWVAQCLEHDIGAQGPDVDTLMSRLEVVLKAECKASLEKGEKPFSRIEPAPARFEQMWERRARSVDMVPAPWMTGVSSDHMHVGLGLIA
jgi:hypothetical protein